MNSAQSLADGAAGVALAHLETGDRPAAFEMLRRATVGGVSIASGASLFYGTPALAFVLASTDHPGLARARAVTAEGTATVTRRRLDAAHRRIDEHQQPHYAEYDLIRGLTGLGVVLRRLGDHDLLRQVLDYLVRLAEPLDGLPGWWCWNEPEHGQPPAGGHSNHGMAHGITGPLALLSLALRDGITVDGHTAAIARICQWLDTWQQDTDGLTWWPQTLSPAELHHGQPAQRAPLRPSWCYGTPGLVRAQQLAALAVGDRRRRRIAEGALWRCVIDPSQLALFTDAGLCLGTAGLYQTVWRIAADAESPNLADQLPRLGRLLAASPAVGTPGLLTGGAGQSLVVRTASGYPPITGWDASLLLH